MFLSASCGELMVKNSNSPEEFIKLIKSLGFTHILMRTQLVDKFLQDNFSQEEITRFLNLTRKYWKQLYESNGYAVWKIQG